MNKNSRDKDVTDVEFQEIYIYLASFWNVWYDYESSKRIKLLISIEAATKKLTTNALFLTKIQEQFSLLLLARKRLRLKPRI